MIGSCEKTAGNVVGSRSDNKLTAEGRLFGLDFARCICILIIIVFHYSETTQNEFRILHFTANGSFGQLSVAVFFAISGMALHLKYPSFPTWQSLRTFWYKRWRAIFPMFYISFLAFFLLKAAASRKLFYEAHPLTLIMTLLGMDGYFKYAINNYSIVGEWFLGAIILLYILYPLICFVMERSRIFIPLFLAAGYVLVLKTDIFDIYPTHNLIVCMAPFYAGIVSMKHYDTVYKNRLTGIVSLILFAVLLFVRIPGDFGESSFVLNQVHGFSLLIVLVQTGEYFSKSGISRAIMLISRLSYPIFLLHHPIISIANILIDPLSIPGEICMLLAVIAVTIVCSQILLWINKRILKSRFFAAADRKLLQ